ncbi:MAG: nitronate monooxygenase [Polyangiales bacterium]
MSLAPALRDQLTLPLVAAPMFLCSGVDLAAEACKAGIMGSLTRNHCRDIEAFAAQLAAVAERLARRREQQPERKIGPLAVNISTHIAGDALRAHLALCRRYGASVIITSVGDPTAIAPLVKDAGLIHYHDATTLRFAEKAIAAGVDGIIAIGAGGGGHSGTLSHLAFIPQVRAMFTGTIVLAGAVSDGATIRAAEILGADLAYMGTRFIATRESSAPDAYKAMLVAGTAADVVYTDAVNGMNAMWLKASLQAAGIDLATLPKPTQRGTAHLPPGAIPWQTVWSAGQGIGAVHDIPSVAELVSRLQAEYLAACITPDMSEAARAALQAARL